MKIGQVFLQRGQKKYYWGQGTEDIAKRKGDMGNRPLDKKQSSKHRKQVARQETIDEGKDTRNSQN